MAESARIATLTLCVSAVLAVCAFAAGCSPMQGTPSAPAPTYHYYYADDDDADEEGEAKEEPEEIDLKELAEGLPYKDMPARYIDKTWLGPCDRHENIDRFHGKDYDKTGGVDCYYWESKNGKHETVFAAYANQGKVIAVSRFGSGTSYWPELFGLPDLYADGKARNIAAGDRPEPLDYDDPEEYAADLEEWYRNKGDYESYDNGDAVGEWEDENY